MKWVLAGLMTAMAGAQPFDGCKHGDGGGCPGPKGCTTATHGCFGENLERVAETFRTFGRDNRDRLRGQDLETFLRRVVEQVRRRHPNAPCAEDFVKAFEEFLKEHRGRLGQADVATFLETFGGELRRIREHNSRVQLDVETARELSQGRLAPLTVRGAFDHLEQGAADARRALGEATPAGQAAFGGRPFDNYANVGGRARVEKDTKGRSVFALERPGRGSDVDVSDLGATKRVDIRKLNDDERARQAERARDRLEQQKAIEKRLEEHQPKREIEKQQGAKEDPSMLDQAVAWAEKQKEKLKERVGHAIDGLEELLNGGTEGENK